VSKTEDILNRELPRLAPGGAGDPFNFVNNVMEFLIRWSSTYKVPTELSADAYCCFVGFDRVNDAVEGRESFKLRPFFREDTPQDLLGHIYFASFTCSSVFCCDCTLKNFSECEALINKLGVRDQPVILFNAAERKIIWRMDAKAEARQAVLRQEPTPKLKSEDFDQALLNFHYEYTATPQGYTKPWENASKLLTKPGLEAEIRDDLFLCLRFLIQEQVAVIREFFGSAGRTDLLVVFRAENVVFYVELKVLRGFVKSGKSRKSVAPKETIKWGKKGIAQAFNYKRTNSNVGTAYACCFDARSKNQEIAELDAFAKETNVEYKRYFMFSSAEDFHASVTH
jgi:hypothetical protein